MKEIKAKFAIFDADDSGQINAAELATVLRAVGLNPTEHHVQELLEEYDADDSGALSFAEFARLYVEELESVEEADRLFKNAFQFFDKDGNGEISLVEFRTVLTQLGDPMDDDEVSLFFKLVDRNNDGMLDLGELCSSLASEPELIEGLGLPTDATESDIFVSLSVPSPPIRPASALAVPRPPVCAAGAIPFPALRAFVRTRRCDPPPRPRHRRRRFGFNRNSSKKLTRMGRASSTETRSTT